MKAITPIMGVIALASIAIYSLSQGIDSTVLITISTIIGGICGFTLKPVLSLVASKLKTKSKT